MAGANVDSFVAAEWNAIALSDAATESFVAPYAKFPVGKRNGPWPKLLNGDPLAA